MRTESAFDPDITSRVGARGLRIILEELMLDLMYTLPSQSDIKECVIDEDVVMSRTHPLAVYKKAG